MKKNRATMKEQKGEVELRQKKRKIRMKKNRLLLKKKLLKRDMGIYEDIPKKRKSSFQKQLDDLKEQLGKATKKEMKLPKSDEGHRSMGNRVP